MYTCLPRVYLMPKEVKRGRRIPWNWSTFVVSQHVGAGNQTLPGPLEEQQPVPGEH